MRPLTAVLARGFDPALSVGSARPAVFRSSTYVFTSPEAAERAFAIAGGRAQATPGEHVDLIYSRFNHPNAEILEDQIVPLEKGAKAAVVFNSGMAAIMTSILAFARPGDRMVYTVPLYGGTQHLIHEFLEPFGIRGTAVRFDEGFAPPEPPSWEKIRPPEMPANLDVEPAPAGEGGNKTSARQHRSRHA